MTEQSSPSPLWHFVLAPLHLLVLKWGGFGMFAILVEVHLAVALLHYLISRRGRPRPPSLSQEPISGIGNLVPLVIFSLIVWPGIGMLIILLLHGKT
jgi:hypothetical protein